MLFYESQNTLPLKIDTHEFDTLTQEQFKKTDKIHREYIEKSRNKIKELNHAWDERVLNSHNVLQEKMTLFWANHFVVKEDNAVFVQQYNNVLRQHALGNLGDFVKAISKEPAMIKYLNTKQNRKQSPNENFAREY